LIKRLESNRPIREKQTLYPWLTFHFDGVRLVVAMRERCAANEQWRFQCDGGRRIEIKTALNTRIEDGREGPEDD
ncbi:hypothetical protein T4A_14471, partial [Trichinella pseudospiralis]